jgi:uncharacterized protein (DUF934 family)
MKSFTPERVYTQEDRVPENQDLVLRIVYFLTTKATPLKDTEGRLVGYRVPVREFERLRNKVRDAQAITVQEVANA